MKHRNMENEKLKLKIEKVMTLIRKKNNFFRRLIKVVVICLNTIIAASVKPVYGYHIIMVYTYDTSCTKCEILYEYIMMPEKYYIMAIFFFFSFFFSMQMIMNSILFLLSFRFINKKWSTGITLTIQ